VHCPAPVVARSHPPTGDVVALVEKELDRTRGSSVSTVCLYTPGSALDTSEIQRDVLLEVVQRIVRAVRPRRLMLESRPELVDEAYTAEIVDVAGATEVSICLPLESADPGVRSGIGKMFTNREYVVAATKVVKAGAVLTATVLLKPPGLAESDAVVDARRSISWLSAIGPSRIVLEPMFVYEGTPLASLLVTGRYNPPWLWSIAAAVEAAVDGRVVVGGEFVYPPPLRAPANCRACTERIWKTICGNDGCSATKALLSAEACECIETWLRLMDGVPTRLREHWSVRR